MHGTQEVDKRLIQIILILSTQTYLKLTHSRQENIEFCDFQFWAYTYLNLRFFFCRTAYDRAHTFLNFVTFQTCKYLKALKFNFLNQSLLYVSETNARGRLLIQTEVFCVHSSLQEREYVREKFLESCCCRRSQPKKRLCIQLIKSSMHRFAYYIKVILLFSF